MLDLIHGTLTGRAIFTPGPVLNAGERVALTPAQAADLMDRGLFVPDPVAATTADIPKPPLSKPVKGRV